MNTLKFDHTQNQVKHYAYKVQTLGKMLDFSQMQILHHLEGSFQVKIETYLYNGIDINPTVTVPRHGTNMQGKPSISDYCITNVSTNYRECIKGDMKIMSEQRKQCLYYLTSFRNCKKSKGENMQYKEICSIREVDNLVATYLIETEIILSVVSPIKDIIDPKMHTKTKVSKLGNLPSQKMIIARPTSVGRR